MDDEPSTETPSPKRQWGILQWLLLLTPSLLMIVGVVVGTAAGAGLRTEAEGEDNALPAVVSLIITGPIALILCILLTSKLVDERSTNAFLGLIGIIGINYVIAFVACARIVNSF